MTGSTLKVPEPYADKLARTVLRGRKLPGQCIFKEKTKLLDFIIFATMKEKTNTISQLIRRTIDSIDPKAKVILYGSRARGDEHADSDWDILILTDYPVDLETENKFRDKLYDLELETGEPLSIFIYSKDEWRRKQRITPFYRSVNKEGISL